MLKGIFLDDERNPEDVTWIEYPSDVIWTVVRTPEDFYKAVDSHDNAVMSFDHDIQCFKDGKEITGYDILKEICNNNYLSGVNFYMHTKNPVGKKNMEEYVSCYKRVLGAN